MKKQMVIFTVVLCLSLFCGTPTYSENSKEITVYGRVTFNGQAVPGASVEVEYVHPMFHNMGNFIMLVRENIKEVTADQYGYYYMKCNVDLDRIEELKNSSPGNLCWVDVDAFFSGLWDGACYWKNYESSINIKSGKDTFEINHGLTNEMWGPVPRIIGKFVDSKGEAIGGAKVIIYAYNDYAGEWDLCDKVHDKTPEFLKTNEDGSFICFLSNVRYSIEDSSYLYVSCLKKTEDGKYKYGSAYITRSSDNIDENDVEDYHVNVISK